MSVLWEIDRKYFKTDKLKPKFSKRIYKHKAINMKLTYRNIINKLTLALFTFTVNQASAQLNPMGSVYFQNQYLANPSFAGINNGLILNAGYSKQLTGFPGSPSIQSVTAEYAMTPKAGLGLNVYNEEAGLLQRTRALMSYAYHLPLSENASNKLSFGLSMGVLSERIMSENLNGDPNDTELGNYNNRKAYLDGDFGIAYSSNKLNIQAAFPNLKSVFKKDLIQNTVDRSTFFSAISYKMVLGSEFDLEPKIAYRGVKGFDNIIDAGANFSYLDKVNFFSMYHSSKSSSFGLGMIYQSFAIMVMYTTSSSAFSNYTNVNFEISMKINL